MAYFLHKSAKLKKDRKHPKYIEVYYNLFCLKKRNYSRNREITFQRNETFEEEVKDMNVDKTSKEDTEEESCTQNL